MKINEKDAKNKLLFLKEIKEQSYFHCAEHIFVFFLKFSKNTNVNLLRIRKTIKDDKWRRLVIF